METATANTASTALNINQRAALINLLGDEDPSVYEAVRERILAVGASSREWLRPFMLSRDPLRRRRATEIIRFFDRQSADNRFLAFCLQHGENLDLESGAWLLAQTQYPEINVEAYAALLDSFAGELQQRIVPHARAHSLLTHFNGYLFGHLGFAGNEKNFYDPDNSYLNCVLDRRTGNPINLCLLYLLLARRLRLPVSGIGLPGHFLCRYQSASEELFIDAFNRGKVMTKADCIHYLVRGNYDLREEYLSPVSPRRILTRICGNLHQIYSRLGHPEAVTRFQRYLVALGR
ncbi:MAG: transglutaminase family protein [Verrucomicrobiae bacterium]|nr:transglutaminase family protein [Verrucomicrobiae bacterium]